MRRFLLFLLPILIIVTIGMTIFGFLQVRSEEEKMMDDLRRKAKTVAESIEATSLEVFRSHDSRSALRLVDSFQKRERMQGCVLYDADGRLLAITYRISEWDNRIKEYLNHIENSKEPFSGVGRFDDYTVYLYALSIMDDDGRRIGAVVVVYDTSYMYPIFTAIWRRLAVTLIAMLTFIVIILFLIQRKIFTIPIRQLTEWFYRFQKGEVDSGHPIRTQDELAKLASEVEQIALSLRVARKSISKKAAIHLKRTDLWTESKLRDLIHAKLGIHSFFVVSNREPYIHSLDASTGQPVCTRPASGVVTAINPILRSSGGTWIAHGSGNADRQTVNSKDKLGVPPEDQRYILKRVWLNKEEEEGYYYGFSNEGLWPLCHVTHTRPVFRESNWKMYQAVNQKFADAVLEELPAKNPFIFIQDYHFTLLGKMIKDKRPDAGVALFWHIPWPNPEIVAICPYYKELLDGMLGCDLIGFHVQYHCNNFLDTVNRLLECRVDTERFSVVRNAKETFVKAFPISVDSSMEKTDPESRSRFDLLAKKHDFGDMVLAVSVDRIDYTKGIVERILAIDRFLEKHPEYKNRFVFIQLAAPSRTHIKRYHDLGGEIEELVDKKNWKHSDGNWKPILYFERHFTPEEIQPYFAHADLCIVSPLHDGMNLVAKEYVMAKVDLNGVLILSEFTGAARELEDAVKVNPYSIEEFADAIHRAVSMPQDEKKERMKNLRRTVKTNNVYRWAADIINEWTSIQPTMKEPS